ncbi:MAG: hypothetical protein U9O90_05035 [Euryarchaeota archaeon]|nr:hypothetical protein [Euryarchaeota archaeon]
MLGLNHNSMAAILKLTYRCDAFHNFVSFEVYDGVNLSIAFEVYDGVNHPYLK